MKQRKVLLFSLLCVLALCLTACAPEQDSSTNPAPDTEFFTENTGSSVSTSVSTAEMPSSFDLTQIPEFEQEPYVILNNNIPTFTASDLITESYEFYSPQDSLGRCNAAIACIGRDLMPTEKRDSIGQVKPSGWQTVKYDLVDGHYLYNRCHLIGYQLTGENANAQNLITGTRYMNVEGMLPFENMVADYIVETGNHVLYRVTPIYNGDDLVASGVQMEAESVEDHGDGILFHVYVYNVQPGITIDYATGGSTVAESNSDTSASESSAYQTYILNTNSHKFHLPSCSDVKTIKDSNRQSYTGSRNALLSEGYTPCGRCHP